MYMYVYVSMCVCMCVCVCVYWCVFVCENNLLTTKNLTYINKCSTMWNHTNKNERYSKIKNKSNVVCQGMCKSYKIKYRGGD